jgi:hypothetical protein
MALSSSMATLLLETLVILCSADDLRQINSENKKFPIS